MAGSEPLIQEADPHIMKLAIEARMKDKDGPNKINKSPKKEAFIHILFASNSAWKHFSLETIF